jgi:hypothetical protein
MLSVIMLSVVMLNVVMPNVVAPFFMAGNIFSLILYLQVRLEPARVGLQIVD